MSNVSFGTTSLSQLVSQAYRSGQYAASTSRAENGDASVSNASDVLASVSEAKTGSTTVQTSSTSTGGENSGSQQGIMSRDQNGDNLLTREELGISEEAFASLDANGDGTADPAELKAEYEKRQARFIAQQMFAPPQQNDSASEQANKISVYNILTGQDSSGTEESKSSEVDSVV